MHAACGIKNFSKSMYVRMNGFYAYMHESCILCIKVYQSPVSSVVEHQTFNLRVTGSNPVLGDFIFVSLYFVNPVMSLF